MKSRTICAVGAAILFTGVFAPSAAQASPSATAPEEPEGVVAEQQDNLPDPLAEKRTAEKAKAAELVATGQAKVKELGAKGVKSKAVEIAPGDWVEYGTQDTAQLFSILVQFGDQPDDRFPDATPGPRANQIPEPGASDNSTYWQPDFSREHFMDMFFAGMPEQGGESFKQLYTEMSSGRFELKGDVSDWVTIPYNGASYGEEDTNQADMTRFIQDTADAWYDDQLAQGKTQAEIEEYLATFDVWDRYDLDGDGITNEPDGYIDHFQAIHAGEGEEAGAPISTIWSHRWAVNQAGQGVDGPADYPKVGGVRIGDTDMWIRDYTTEPENGGLGVFAHEFGHDLGLPDYYDTSGGDNGTAFWNLMSSGSWLGHGTGDIGTTPSHMGATEKLFLGWLDYAVVESGQSGTVQIGPSFHASTRPQAVIVTLPDGETRMEVGPAASGTKYFYSGQGDVMDNTVTSPVFTVPDGATLTAKVDTQIEEDWDYAYLEASTDGGATWVAVETNLSRTTNPNGGNLGLGITGATDGWVDLTADLSALAGQDAQVRFRYVTDAAVSELGFKVDDVAVGDALSTDVEDGASDWTLDGFIVVSDGAYAQPYTHFYVAENRVYGGYDKVLRTGPYNFGQAVNKPNTVQHFPYQDGLLVWYVNSLYTDNNTAEHPGYGQALPVDAHPKALTWSDGAAVRNRIQSFDATFGLQATDKLQLTREVETDTGVATSVLTVKPQAPAKVFDDTNPARYYDASNPQNSVLVAGSGTKITVKDINAKSGLMTLNVVAGTTVATQ